MKRPFLKGIREQGRLLEHIDHKSKRETNYLGERKSNKMKRGGYRRAVGVGKQC